MQSGIGAQSRVGGWLRVGVLLALIALTTAAGWSEVRPAWVIPEVVNVRKGPGTDHPMVAHTTRGTKVFVEKFRSGWCYAKLPSGTWGWIREDLLQFSYDRGRKLAAEASGANSLVSGSNPPVWVSVGAANVRNGPGLGYSKYGTLPRGTKCYVADHQGEWLRCRTPGGWGWLHTSVVTSDVAEGRRLAAQAPSPPKAFVDGNVVNLRQGPGLSHEVMAKLRRGQTVWVLDTEGDWSKVQVAGGNSGWIASRLLKSSSEASSSTPPPAPPNFPSPQSSRFRTLEAWIDEQVTNVREGPGTDHPAKFQLKKGDKVTVTDLDGHWCRVKTASGKTGWIAGWVIDFSPPGEEFMAPEGDQQVEVKVGWVARPKINLRSGPGLNYPRVGTLTLSTQVVIVGQQGDWYQVAMDNREVGWAASWLVDTREQRLARRGLYGDDAGASSATLSSVPRGLLTSEGSEKGRAIVRTAMRYLGDRYVRGGESPGSFDCSGLVQYVLGRHGISAARTCPGLLRQGRPVSRESLSPGDVVFFKNTYRSGISHVGFYLGGGNFIHASNPGSGVKITALDSSYYARRYVGARRMY